VIRALLTILAAMLALLTPALSPAAAKNAPEEIMLWPGTPPGNGSVTGPEKIGGEGAGFGAVSNIAVPRMRVYRPAAPNGAAVLVAGGGGYFRIQLWKESTPAAEWLQAQGFTVFELIYRLPNDGWDAGAPFMDAQRAMKIIRTRAGEFGVQRRSESWVFPPAGIWPASPRSSPPARSMPGLTPSSRSRPGLILRCCCSRW
jgi:acetyl esterase/lipase